MKLVKQTIAACVILLSAQTTSAELLGAEWITEAEMKKQSGFARQHSLLLVNLNCRFKEGVENPGREDVVFRADFEQVIPAQAWGWTFDANARIRGPEKRAEEAGFAVASEDYFEISGVTWVRCKVWHRPQ